MTYIVRDASQSKPIEITCGTMRKFTDPTDFKDMDIVQVTITNETKKHYHKKLTEVYYVVKGSIKMEIDDKIEHLSKNQMIMVFPNTNHKAWKTSDEDAEILVICSPPWAKEDEILLE